MQSILCGQKKLDLKKSSFLNCIIKIPKSNALNRPFLSPSLSAWKLSLRLFSQTDIFFPFSHNAVVRFGELGNVNDLIVFFV